MNSDWKKNLAVRIRARRRELDLSQQDLARKIKVQPGTISYFETGLRTPSLENLRRLASVFDVTTDYLLGLPGKNVEAGTGEISKMMNALDPEDQEMAKTIMVRMLQHPKPRKDRRRPGKT